MDRILRIPLIPVLAVQGLMVRSRAQMLPEPGGPRRGRTGSGPPLRLLVTGDSSAAGVGVGAQAEALSGALVSRLSQHAEVDWRLEATTGHRTRDTLDRLAALPDLRFDVAVVALGVNDTTRFMSPKAFARRQAELAQILINRFGVRLVLLNAIPPIAQFPLLPNPLAWTLGRHAERLEAARQAKLAQMNEAEILAPEVPFDPKYIAEDGFHPNALAYSVWAEQLDRRIRLFLQN
jgi:lysophospholipase L1-like esterase